ISDACALYSLADVTSAPTLFYYDDRMGQSICDFKPNSVAMAGTGVPPPPPFSPAAGANPSFGSVWLEREHNDRCQRYAGTVLCMRLEPLVLRRHSRQ